MRSFAARWPRPKRSWPKPIRRHSSLRPAGKATPRQTREEADRYREQATVDAEKIESQANSKAVEAEAAAQQTREETNRYAERIKAEAEEILAQVSAEAERLARERHRLTEGLRNLAEDFRRTSDALASSLDPDPPHQGVDSDSAAGR